MARRRPTAAAVRDWFFCVVGSALLIIYIVRTPAPNLWVVVALGCFSGAPGMAVLADFLVRRRENGD